MKLSVTKDLAPLRAAAVAAILDLSARNRNAYATPGKDAVYLSKRDEAIRWVHDGSPADLADYPYLAAEVGVTEPTAHELAQTWLNLNALWVGILAPRIEGKEKMALRAIAQATTPAQIEAVVSGWAPV